MKAIEPDKIFAAELIISTKTRRGSGLNSLEPIRVITEIYTLDGEKIAEYDPCAGEVTFTVSDLVDFYKWAKLNQPTTEVTRETVLSWVNSIK